MANVRRTPYALFYLIDDPTLDLAAIVAGPDPLPDAPARVVALALLTGKQYPLSHEETQLLRDIPATDWVSKEELGRRSDLDGLLRAGVVVSDSDEPGATVLREREAAFQANEWNLYAALYHFMTRWSGVWMAEGEDEATILSAKSREAARKLVAEHGRPPPAYVEIDGSRRVQLERRDVEGQLYSALLARRTTRDFDTGAAMSLDQLDVALRYVFGAHGYAYNAAEEVCIKRTSPSGGATHPIEVYPIIAHVDGVEPGIYHYNCGSHSLGLLDPLDADGARQLATRFMGGQGYFGSAHVTFVLTARFYRNHWKYRRHQKAYAGVLMDAAHLSQTLYLVAADLGLGAFFTLAINGGDIEERLGLDGVSEGVIAMSGCGPRAAGSSPLELQFAPGMPPEQERL